VRGLVGERRQYGEGFFCFLDLGLRSIGVEVDLVVVVDEKGSARGWALSAMH
jgi:hypothetical protein